MCTCACFCNPHIPSTLKRTQALHAPTQSIHAQPFRPAHLPTHHEHDRHVAGEVDGADGVRVVVHVGRVTAALATCPKLHHTHEAHTPA